MSKNYISGDRLQQVYDNIVESPILEDETEYYLIGVKDGRLYRVRPDGVVTTKTTSVAKTTKKVASVANDYVGDEQGLYQY